MPTITVNISETTFISSAQPDNNFSTYPLMYVGTDSSYQRCISLFKVNLQQIPVSAVQSAKLEFSVIAKNGDTPSNIIINNVTSPFVVSNVTYNTAPSLSFTSTSINVSKSDLYKRVQIDITKLVNEWLSGSSQNNGIALTNSDSTTLVEFATKAISYEPYYPTIIITYSEVPPVEDSALCFSYAQLAHVIEQLISLYPDSPMTVYTKGLTTSSVTGIPYELFKSSSGTYGSLLILKRDAQQLTVPINTITAIALAEGSVYNPSITYLKTQGFTPGCDANIITAYHEYLPVSSYVSITSGTVITVTGNIYKNEYGLIVMTDSEGNNPAFVPVFNINAILPAAREFSEQGSENYEVIIKTGKTDIS